MSAPSVENEYLQRARENYDEAIDGEQSIEDGTSYVLSSIACSLISIAESLYKITKKENT